ncbi:hypothetical protein L484_001967 [Morus notabilis]|uniref:Uncharacterized protein n=1 Tax=Morus notabilis TaxID=981085 RepID=W9R3U1_9ROSA|nr:hypothetical protein L484_001967 [Morus notabilis]
MKGHLGSLLQQLYWRDFIHRQQSDALDWTFLGEQRLLWQASEYLQHNPFFPAPAESPVGTPPLIPVKTKLNKLSTGAIIGIVLGASFGHILVVLRLILCFRRRERLQSAKASKPVATSRAVVGASAAEARTSSLKDNITGEPMETERNRLVLFKGGIYSFNFLDLEMKFREKGRRRRFF